MQIIKATRGGVFYDLSASPYKIAHCGFTFYFSSKLHRDKFRTRLPGAEEDFLQRMRNRWGLAFSHTVLPAILLYRTIETRGFYIRIPDQYGGGETIIENADSIKVSINIGVRAEKRGVI